MDIRFESSVEIMINSEFRLQTATHGKMNRPTEGGTPNFFPRESAVARGKILVVGNDASFRFSVRAFLQLQGYEVYESESCQSTLGVFQSFGPDIVVSDYSLPDGSALELMPRLKSVDPDLRFLIITRHGTIDLAVQV